MIALPATIGAKLTLQSLRGSDEAIYYSLPSKWQNYVLSYFAIFNELANSRNVKAASIELAERNSHLGRGFSAKTIRRLWREYRRSNDWKILLNDYQGTKDPLPADFLEELRRRIEKNKRVAAPVFKELRREWAAGKVIPGYGTWRDHWAKVHGDDAPEFFPDDFFPRGWDERNLYRHLPSDAQLTLARDGHKAAHALLPQIERTTAGLRPLEGVVFDDVRTDWLVIVPGQENPVELWLLVAMDIATRKIIAWVAKAYLTDDDGKRQELLRAEMRRLVGSVLQLGLPEGYPIRFVVENQKATLSDEEKRVLAEITGDRVLVTKSGMTHRTILPGGYSETSGQPWFKAPLESFFNLFHNELAALPGQTGASYALMPGELEGRKKAARALLKAAAEADLPADVIRQLKAPFLHYHEAIDALAAIIDLLNNRVEHELEGFEQRAFFRFSPRENFRPIEELARYPREQIKLAQIKHRVESSQERWVRLALAERFTPVSELALLPFIAKSVPEIEVFKPYHVRIRKVVYRADHERLAVERREQFTAKVLETDPSLAHLFDSAGSYVCALRCTEKVGWFDEAAHERAFAEQAHYRALIEQPLRERHAADAGEREAAAEHNDALIQAHRAGSAMVAGAERAKRLTRRESEATVRQNAERSRRLAQRARAQIEASP